MFMSVVSECESVCDCVNEFVSQSECVGECVSYFVKVA